MMTRRERKPQILLTVLLSWSAGTWMVGCASSQGDASWRQWGGPQRNFMVDQVDLAEEWPESGPNKLWSRELGDGYATIVAENGRIYTQYRVGEEEVEHVIALDAATGETIWDHEHPSTFTDHMKQFGPGPASTPVVVGDHVYAIGTNLVMHCINKNTGEPVWKIDFVESMDAKVPGRGYCASPLPYGDTLIVAVGGMPEQALVAVNKADGSIAWKAHDYAVTHSSPLLIEFEGEEQVVFATKQDLIGVSPSNGELLWSAPLNAEGVYLSSPLWTGDDLIFISSAYGGGSHSFRLAKEGDKTVASELWYDRKMRIHHGNAIRVGDTVFGSSGDFGPAFLAGIDINTGKLKWRERGFSKSTMVYADGKVVLLDEDGHLALARMNAEGMEVISKIKVAELYAWAAPTLVGKTLFVRDRKHIMAFDLG